MATEPVLSYVDCIRFPVPDLAAGLRFYRDSLGHQLLWKTANAAGLQMPDSQTEIVLYTEITAPDYVIKVQNTDYAARAIEKAGGKIIKPPFDVNIGRWAVVQDPWGNLFSILDLSKGPLATDSEGNVVDKSS
jgi:lactoylglutathione lyase